MIYSKSFSAPLTFMPDSKSCDFALGCFMLRVLTIEY
jgi:hypothetical protein